MVSSAVAKVVCSSLVGSRCRLAVRKVVWTGPNWSWTPSIEVAGAMKLAMSNWMSGSAVCAIAGRSGFQAIPSSMVSRAAAAPAEPALSMVRRRTGSDDLAVGGCASMADPWDGWLAGIDTD